MNVLPLLWNQEQFALSWLVNYNTLRTEWALPEWEADIVVKHVVEERIDTVVGTAEDPQQLLYAEIQLEEGLLVNEIPTNLFINTSAKYIMNCNVIVKVWFSYSLTIIPIVGSR